MANKRNREIWAKEENKRKFNAATQGMYIWSVISILTSVVILLLFFVPWGGVYNSKAGSYEAPIITGFQTFGAAMSGKYSDMNNYGGMYIFYHFCEEQTLALGIMTIIVFFLNIANVAVQIVTLATKKYSLNCISAVISVAIFALLLIAFIVSLGIAMPLMKGYQCDLKVCVYRSYVIIPAIVSLAAAVVSVIGLLKFADAKKLLK